jgi:hypothetical protein
LDSYILVEEEGEEEEEEEEEEEGKTCEYIQIFILKES